MGGSYAQIHGDRSVLDGLDGLDDRELELVRCNRSAGQEFMTIYTAIVEFNKRNIKRRTTTMLLE